MSDLTCYIHKRKKRDTDFATGFEEGYADFQIGFIVRNWRKKIAAALGKQVDIRIR